MFIYSFPYAEIASTRATLNNYFQLNFEFNVISITNFTVELHAKYPLSVKEFEIKLFIYNKADFTALYVKIDYTIFTYSNIAAGSSLSKIYTSIFAAPSSQIMFGICGFDFAQYSDIGFDFKIDTATLATTHTIDLNNTFISSNIPSLQLMVLLASEFRCANYEKLIDPTLLICYVTSCPTGEYKSALQVGITGIYICHVCDYTCG